MDFWAIIPLNTIELYAGLTFRLILAGLLGGIIGYERESMNRPAGFRTHILVCVGSALVMVTSEFIFREYRGLANLDPTRLGAQVISGIGFLGAGTIIREGFNVKGLTTAASLWAVSCVGIAAGIGFYEGAISATLIIYLTLILLKRMESHFAKKNQFKILFIKSDNRPGLIGLISNIFVENDILIKNIEFVKSENEDNTLMKFLIKLPGKMYYELIIDKLQSLDGILKVYE